MRQFDADLRRFFARRLVRVMFLVVAAIILVVVAAATIAGHAVSDADRQKYRDQVEQIQQMRPELPRGVDNGKEIGPIVYPSEPRDTRIDLHTDVTEALEGTGIALLFLAFMFGASFIGADHNAGSLTTQLLYEPRRLRVHASKAVAAALGCALVGAALLALLSAALYVGASVNGVTTGADAAWWADRVLQVLRISGAIALAGGMTYGVTLVARRTTAGVIAFFLQYPLMFLINPHNSRFGFISKYMPLRGLMGIVIDPIRLDDPNLLVLHTFTAAIVLSLVWLAVILLVSGRVFARAEIR